jgi:hypothetical protein
MSTSVYTGPNPLNFIRKHFLQIWVRKVVVHLEKMLEVMSTVVYTGLNRGLSAQRLSEPTVYHIISYHIMSCHHIIYHILYHIISYHISYIKLWSLNSFVTKSGADVRRLKDRLDVSEELAAFFFLRVLLPLHGSWKLKFALKCQCVCIKLHGVTFQKMIVFIDSAVRNLHKARNVSWDVQTGCKHVGSTREVSVQRRFKANEIRR